MNRKGTVLFFVPMNKQLFKTAITLTEMYLGPTIYCFTSLCYLHSNLAEPCVQTLYGEYTATLNKLR